MTSESRFYRGERGKTEFCSVACDDLGVRSTVTHGRRYRLTAVAVRRLGTGARVRVRTLVVRRRGQRKKRLSCEARPANSARPQRALSFVSTAVVTCRRYESTGAERVRRRRTNRPASNSVDVIRAAPPADARVYSFGVCAIVGRSGCPALDRGRRPTTQRSLLLLIIILSKVLDSFHFFFFYRNYCRMIFSKTIVNPVHPVVFTVRNRHRKIGRQGVANSDR